MVNQTDVISPIESTVFETEPGDIKTDIPVEPPVDAEEIHTEHELTGTAPTRKPPQDRQAEPNPLLLDPYEFDHCTLTILYTRVGDQQASVSVHNHKDDPIVKIFPLLEAPMPLPIACVIERLLEIWPAGRVSATMVLLPLEGEVERRMVVSIRTGGDTPIVLAGPVSEFPLPPPITTLLQELKELLPTRAMQKIEKEAKAKVKTNSKPITVKTTAPTPAKAAPVTNDGKTQMTLC